MAVAMGNGRRAAAAEQPLPLPPAAVVLQIAETTASIQGMLMQSVKDMDDLTEQQRKDVGRWPPINRNELKKSVDVLLSNSRLATMPNGSEAAGILNGVKLTANAGSGAITRDEYIIMAKQFGQTRDALRKVFELFSEAQQAEGRAIVREQIAADEERIRQVEEEAEKVRLIREKIAAAEQKRAADASGTPPRKKTLKELEEANAAFSKQQKPAVSLYGL